MMKRSLAAQICHIYLLRTLPLESSSNLEVVVEEEAQTVRMTPLMPLWLRWR